MERSRQRNKSSKPKAKAEKEEPITAVLRPVNGFGIKDLNMETTRLEKTNLEAHVDLCAERYKQLETRLDTIETKIEEIAKTISENKNSLATTIISSAGTVVVGIIGLILAILFKF